MHKGARNRKVSRSKGWYIRIFLDKQKSAFHPPHQKRVRAFFQVHYIFKLKNPQSPRPPLSDQKSLGQLDLYPKKGEKTGIRARALKHYKWVHYNLNKQNKHTINYTKIYNQKFKTEEHMISHELHILVIPKPSQTVSGLSKFRAPRLPFNPTSIILNTTLR